MSGEKCKLNEVGNAIPAVTKNSLSSLVNMRMNTLPVIR